MPPEPGPASPPVSAATRWPYAVIAALATALGGYVAKHNVPTSTVPGAPAVVVAKAPEVVAPKAPDAVSKTPEVSAKPWPTPHSIEMDPAQLNALKDRLEMTIGQLNRISEQVDRISADIAKARGR